MINIDKGTIAHKENRSLEKWQPFIKNNGEINNNFGKDFDAWFSDRFFLRDLLIEIHYNQYIFSKNLRTKKVIKGKDNWLFNGVQTSIDMYTNKNLLSEDDLIKVKKYLTNLNEYCKKHNKKFYFVIAPSKPKIYGEYFSDLIKIEKENNVSCAEQIIDYLSKNTDVKVIYPRENILKNKDKGLLYFKTDSHWNELGAYFGYEGIIKEIKKDHPNIPIYKYKNLITVQEHSGDINRNLPKILKMKEFPEYKKPDPKEPKYSCQKTNSTADIQYCSSPFGKGKLLVFRDSFTTFLVPYLASSFNKSIYVWKQEVDFSYMQDADVVILEIVEISLPDLVKLSFEGK